MIEMIRVHGGSCGLMRAGKVVKAQNCAFSVVQTPPFTLHRTNSKKTFAEVGSKKMQVVQNRGSVAVDEALQGY